MHPSSVFKYFLNNRKRFAIVTLAVMLGVFLLYSLSTVIDSMKTAYERASVEPMAQFSIVSAWGSYLSEGTIEAIERQDSVEKVIPLYQYNISLRMSVGGYNGTPFMVVKPDQIGYLMDLMGLRLLDGRLPAPGKLEMIMNADIAKNLGVKIGDSVGSGLNNGVRFSEEYRVVGLLEGRSLVSFGVLLINDAWKYNVIVVPKEGRHRDMDEYLRNLQSGTVAVSSYDQATGMVRQTTASIDLLITGVSITVVIIISLCVSFLCYIYFMQRQSEYGLLWAIGYTRQQLVNKAFIEVGSMNLAGFALGLGLSLMAALIMKATFYQGFGQILDVIDMDALSKAVCVPVFSTFFSLTPIWRLMKKTDPVHVMEA